MTIIRIEVKEKPKLVLFYLNQKEAADGKILKSIKDNAQANQKESADGKILKSIKDNAQALKNLSYLSVVVESGENDLADSLYCLMKQNRKAAAEKLSA